VEALVQVRGTAAQQQQIAGRAVPHQAVQPADALRPVERVERRVPGDVQRLLVLRRRVAAQPEPVDERVVADVVRVARAELVDDGGLLPGGVPVGVGEHGGAGAAPQPAQRVGGEGEAGGHLDQLEAAGADDERRALEDRPAVVARRRLPRRGRRVSRSDGPAAAAVSAALRRVAVVAVAAAATVVVVRVVAVRRVGGSAPAVPPRRQAAERSRMTAVLGAASHRAVEVVAHDGGRVTARRVASSLLFGKTRRAAWSARRPKVR
jgi:hypothetical protein